MKKYSKLWFTIFWWGWNSCLMGQWAELNALSLKDLIRLHTERETHCSVAMIPANFWNYEESNFVSISIRRNYRLVPCYHVCLNMSHVVCLPLLNVTNSGNRGNKTFKPKKNIPEGSHQYELLKHAEATLGSGNLRMAVMLPDGEDLNEWVAVNSKHQFHQYFPLSKHIYVYVPSRVTRVLPNLFLIVTYSVTSIHYLVILLLTS